MLAIGQDGPLPLDRLDIEVEYAGKTLRRSSFRVPEEAALPTTLAISSNGDPTASVKIVVVGWSDDLPLDRRDAIVTQVPSERVARLDIVLSGRCSKRVMLEADGTASSTCGEGRTCAPDSGNCTSATVNAKSLPSYSSGDEGQLAAGGSDGVGNGGSGADAGHGGDAGKGGSSTAGSAGEGGRAGEVSSAPGGAGGAKEPVGMSGAGGEGGVPAVAVCGDGAVSPGEACDDGNHDYADGCTGTCRQIEAGYSCDASTNVCSPAAVCGNGVLETPFEECDDRNASSNDGCSASCQREPGFTCSRPGARCLPFYGDGIVTSAEMCDDTGRVNGDGCSATGKLEPGYFCSTPGMKCALSTCGNGAPEGYETCDDQNDDPTDGCHNCKRLPICPQAGGVCNAFCGDGALSGGEQCDDGNLFPGDGCSATCTKESGFICAKVVSPLPALVPIVYRDFISVPTGGGVQHPDFETFNSGLKTGLVKNQLSPGGDPEYSGTCSAQPCPVTSAASFNQWFQDLPAINKRVVSSITLTSGAGNTQAFQLSPFFPLDGKGWITAGKELAVTGHNFGFTSEAHFAFTYQGGEQIDFEGDDDVWVFVAGKLGLDLGGVHASMTANVKVDALGLITGELYDVAVFQAERHQTTSNYKLTLKGFGLQASQCASQCGDGVLAPDEECDLGAAENTGQYGKCTATCKLAPGCGDGVQQVPEACDSGAGVPYDGCAADCTERKCGDGKVQAGFEECDEGDVTPGDGCSATCQLE